MDQLGSEEIETDVLAGVLSMLPLPQIVKLRAPSRQLCSAKKTAFKRLSALRDLEAFSSRHRLEVLHRILKKCQNISRICFSNAHLMDCYTTDQEAKVLARIIDRNRKIKTISNVDFKVVSKIKRNLPKIENIKLKISDPFELEFIAKRCSRIKRAEFYLCRSKSPALDDRFCPSSKARKAIKAFLKANKRLISLNLHNVTLNPSDYRLMNDKIEELAFFGANMNNEACDEIARLKNLKKLILSGREVTFKGLKRIGDRLKRLEYLDIAETRLGPSVCGYLSMPGALPRLRRLVVSPSKEKEFRTAIGEGECEQVFGQEAFGEEGRSLFASADSGAFLTSVDSGALLNSGGGDYSGGVGELNCATCEGGAGEVIEEGDLRQLECSVM